MNFQQTILEIKGKSKLGLVGLLTLCIKQVKLKLIIVASKRKSLRMTCVLTKLP